MEIQHLARRYLIRAAAVLLLILEWICKLMGFTLYKISLQNILHHLPAHVQAEALDPLVSEPLNLLIKGYSTDSTLNIINRIVIVWNIRDLLRARANITKTLQIHPEIESYPVRKPLVIVGLQRSGTTLMTRLLSQDPQLRGQYTYEVHDPCEPDFSEDQQDAARLEHVTKKFRMYDDLEWGGTSIHSAHRFDPLQHESSTNLLAHAFFLPNYAMSSASLCELLDWIHNRDLDDMAQRFTYHKKQLKIIGGKEMANDENKRFLLKCGANMYSLDGFFKAYPDAQVIFLHRNLSECLPSLYALYPLLGRWTNVSGSGKSGVGERIMRTTTKFTDNFMSILKHFDEFPAEERPVYDVTYDKLVADPITTVKNIYDRFGMTLTEETEEKMRLFLQRNPQHKFGKHRYSLEEFGLTLEDIYKQFERYILFLAERTNQDPADLI